MQKKGNSNYQNKIYSAFLMALAVLVLIVSCPLKNLLANNSASQSSIHSKSNQTNSKQHFNGHNSKNTSCFATNNKLTFVKADLLQQHKTDAPVVVFNISNHTGYYIHSFLNTVRPGYYVIPNSDYSHLSLFLQHRSLLI